ncbi:unnamed protein product [Echinostoma caproni]|uniref:Recombinase domain-containing protein n=1 Tax=Echinostoma caproni TaxID=27848 RepID=A0A183BFK7_9TREM|nr:unnamed protein product [Echinostoma caproni]
MEVDDEPIFMYRSVIPYSQREGVLKAIEKMERDGVITRVASNVWATPIVEVIKSDGKIPPIDYVYRLTLNSRLIKFAATTMEPEDFS